MSDNIKRFSLSKENDDDCVFTGSAEEWQTDVSRIDILSNSLSSLSEPTYDICKFPHPAKNFDNEFKIRTDTELELHSKSYRGGHASQRKRSKRVFALRDVGRWKPADDFLLIISVFQVNDLDIVWNVVKFSCKFTLEEVQRRWNALLYDVLVSRTARAAIRKMHPEQQEAVHRRAPFSLAEEDLLGDILSTENPSLEDFHNLLDKNLGTFYQSRTAKSLQKHWRLLKKYELLCDQRPSVKFCAAGEIPGNFSDVEGEINIEATKDSLYHGHIDQEIKLMDQQLKRKTRLLEDELGHWMHLLEVSSKRNDMFPKFNSKTFAIVRGQNLRYGMQKRFVSFGRRTTDNDDVDIDLSVEGPVHKVSRYQGVIELRGNGTFGTRNFGKRPFYVDGRPVFPQKTFVIRNNSIFEVCGIIFEFLINKELVEDVCFNDNDTD